MDDQRTDREGGGIKFRKLRIVWSAVCGIICLLLIVFWVRSLSAEDRLTGYLSASQKFRIYSSRGCIVFYGPNTPGQPNNDSWQFDFGAEFWLDKSDARIAAVPHFRYHPEEMWVTLPHWFLLALCAALSTASWMRWRFSLRTLLTAMTIIALVLAVYAARK